MNLNLIKGKSKRTKIFTLITTIAILLCLALNFVLTYFGASASIYFDMTPEGFYSLSGAMKRECDTLFDELSAEDPDKKVRITFCTDPDYLEGSTFARVTYFMALKLQQRYSDLFEVETVNVALDPTAVSQYKATSLTKIGASNVIVSYGDRYLITTINAFWLVGTSSMYHYNGEYRIVSIIKSLTSVNRPAAYFITDHGESYYDPASPDSEMTKSTAAFADLLMSAGLDVKSLKLSEAEAVPEDCLLLIINDPRTDFTYDETKLNQLSYISDTEKIDRYLIKKQGALMVALDYEINSELPTLRSFLYEWGFKFSDSVVVDKESSLGGESEDISDIVAKYSQDSESEAYQIYGEFSDLSSAPITVFSNAGSVEPSYRESTGESEVGSLTATRDYESFLTTSDSAVRYLKDPTTGEITTLIDGEAGKYDLAALAVRKEIDQHKNEMKRSYVFAANSKTFFDSSLIGEASYANYDIVSAVVDRISQIQDYGHSDLGGNNQNSSSSGGKRTITVAMKESDAVIYSNKYVDNDSDKGHVIIKKNHGISNAEKIVITTLVMAVPAAVGIVGIVVAIRRKYL